jgi:hypothetical protein
MQHQHVVPYPAIGRPASGGYAWGYRGGYAGGYRIPLCIPQLACKFPHKYKALADRSASRINPDSPLGAPPLGAPLVPPPCRIHFPKIQCSYSDRSSPSWLSARWMSSLHWGIVEMEQTSLCIFVAAHRERQNVKRELCTRVAPFDEERGSELKRNRFKICL